MNTVESAPIMFENSTLIMAALVVVGVLLVIRYLLHYRQTKSSPLNQKVNVKFLRALDRRRHLVLINWEDKQYRCILGPTDTVLESVSLKTKKGSALPLSESRESVSLKTKKGSAPPLSESRESVPLKTKKGSTPPLSESRESVPLKTKKGSTPPLSESRSKKKSAKIPS